MRIGIDARMYSQTGVGRYIRNIIDKLQSIDKVNEYFIYLRKSEYDGLRFTNPKFHKKLLNVRWHSISEQIIVPYKVYRDQIDVMHFPYFNVPLLYRRKYLLTIHDLIIDHFDTGRASTRSIFIYKLKRLAYKIITKSAIRNATAIIAISRSTEAEIIHHYGTTHDRITVTYDGLDDNFLSLVKKKKLSKLINFSYALYVGNAYPHKNLEKLIEVWNTIRNKTNIKLILVGDDDFFYRRLKGLVQKLKLEKQIIFFGQANDEQLISLYSQAKFLVFPSLMEGFGLPNLEALACNCLPVVSDIPVFREVWSDNLIYFDPHKTGDMAGKILKVIRLPKDIYRKRVAKAKSNAEIYSWDQTARKTFMLYKKICNMFS